jgi:DNA topoisomerase-1
MLVIVESPSKCKKIEEYLGYGYKVVASFGHIRELKTIKNINIEDNFKTNYEIIQEKIKHIDFLEKEIKKYGDQVILATDNDNEGEAIAWHICQVFNLSVEKTKRIIFNEITQTALQKAINNPIFINMNIVNSQQTRQIIDMLIGFTISPMLWKHITAKSKIPLSAGRCQTSVLKLVYENYLEIKEEEKKKENKYFKTIGYFTKLCIPFELEKQYEDKDEMSFFLEQSVNHKHILYIKDPNVIIKQSPKPFITSTIQQKVSNDLNYSPKDTMKICQELYEKGFITYMRTDTKKYSNEFIIKLNQYLNKEWGLKTMIEEKLKDINLNSNNSLSNHEAIRPTNLYFNEYTLKEDKVSLDFKSLSTKLMKVYNIIWKNTIESCMEDAYYNSITCKITAYDNNIFKHITEKIINKKEGWKYFDCKFNKNIQSDETEKSDEDNNKKQTLKIKNSQYDYFFNLLQMNQSKKNTKENESEVVKIGNQIGDEIDYIKIISEEKIKKIKLHYSESLLIKKIEELGIGRPSTYSFLINKIQERNYVLKQNIIGENIECVYYCLNDNELEEKKIIKTFGNEKNKLVITSLGLIVINFLIKYYDDIFNYEYTKDMEYFLDEIEKGLKQKEDICLLCYNELMKNMDNLNDQEKNGKYSQTKIDDKNTFIVGKNGPVIKNTNEEGKIIFLSVRDGIDVTKLENYKIDEIIEKKELTTKSLGVYKGEEIIIKKGKYGIYFIYGNIKKSLSCLEKTKIENIKYEEVVSIIDNDTLLNGVNQTEIDDSLLNGVKENNIKEKTFLRKVSENISIRNGKYGNYIFFKMKNMKTPKFFKLNGFNENILACDLDILQRWIKQKYNIN